MKKLFVALLALACAGALIVAGAYLFWLKAETDGLRRIQEEIKEEGMPTCEGDFFPRVPTDDRTAAVLLQKAAVLVKTIPDDALAARCSPGAVTEKNNTGRLPERQLEEVRDTLGQPASKEIVKLLMEAVAKDECRFSRDYNKGAFLELPDIAPMMRAIRLLLNDSWMQAASGDVEGAAGKIQAAMKISDFYMRDPLLITWLVGVSCEQMSLLAMMDLLAAHEATSGELDRLEKPVKRQRASARSNLLRAFDGERVFFGGSIFQMLLSGKTLLSEILPAFGLSGPGQEKRWTAWTLWMYQHPLRPLLIADNAAYLRFMLAARKEVLDSRVPCRESKTLSARIPRSALLTRLSAPALEPTIIKLREVEAALDIALIGLRAEKLRIASGHYPRSLSEIAWEGELPRDPFTGSDFIYQSDDRSLLIYSVGHDLADNQGNPKKENGERDIVWAVRRAR
ncbi:MAG: hypothetical protein WCH98_08180 [Verrucomicrobiota bacterium]